MRILPGLVISLVSLAILAYIADLRAMVRALKLADLRLLLLSFGISLLWLAVRSAVWRTLLQEKATFSQTFLTINEGYLLNNILPFRLGEIGRALLLSQKAVLGFWEVFSTILIERILDLAFAVGLLLTSLSFVVGAAWASEAAVFAGAIVVAVLLALFLLARNHAWVSTHFDRLAAVYPKLHRAGQGRLESFLSGLLVLTDLRRFLQAAGLMLLNWAVAIAQYYILMLAFIPNARFLWAAFSLGVAALGIAAPSSPGAIGVYELSLVGALSVFRVDASTALAVALSAHLINYLLTGTIGAFALAKDGQSLAGLYQRARRIPQKESF